jgi:hypothetical protein
MMKKKNHNVNKNIKDNINKLNKDQRKIEAIIIILITMMILLKDLLLQICKNNRINRTNKNKRTIKTNQYN